MEFQQPDLLVSDPYQPINLNRYAYSLDNPIRYNDPSGHLATCSPTDDDRPECYRPSDTGYIPTPLLTAQNTQYQKDCASGKNKACPGGAAGGVVFLAGSVATAGILDYALAGGVAADAVSTVGWKVAQICATSSICWSVTGAGGAAVSDAASQAKSWQGTDQYPGVDNWENITINKGSVVWGGEPGQGPFYTSSDTITSAGNDATKIFEGLQNGLGKYTSYRAGMT